MDDMNKVVSPVELSELCVEMADDRQAENIVSLEVSEHGITDFFVLCTGNSEPHIKAISDRIGREARKRYNVRPRTVEGDPSSHWMLMDFGVVVVHIMTPSMREQYQLESLWGDAPKRKAMETLSKGPTD